MTSSLPKAVTASFKSFVLSALCAAVFLSAAWLADFAKAQDALQIDSVSVYGLTVNSTTTFEVRGKGFDESLQLQLPLSMQQKLKLHSPMHAELEVQVGSVIPQLVWGVFRNSSQLSGLRRWSVDAIPNQVFSSPITSLPVSLSGVLSGNQVQRTTVELSEGDYLFVDVQGRRLGATYQPLVRVLDEKNRQVASGGPMLSIDGDAACSFKVQKSGKYQVTLQDLTYAAPTGPFRLRLVRTRDDKFAMGANMASEKIQPSEAGVFAYWAFPDYRSGSPIDWALQGDVSSNDFALPRSLQSSWDRFDVDVLPSEDVPNVGKVMRVPSLPAVIRGTIGRGESVRLVVANGAGKPLDAEVWATRLGSNFDPRLGISTLDQRSLGSGDDRPGTIDPRVRFAGDGNINEVLVTVDSVIPVSARKEVFELVLSQPSVEPIGLELLNSELLVREGSVGLLDVKVVRNGMNHPIELWGVAFGGEADQKMEQAKITVPENQERALVPIQLSGVPTNGQVSASTQWFAVIGKYPHSESPRYVQAHVPGRDVTASGVAEHTIPVAHVGALLDARVAWQVDSGDSFEWVAGLNYEIPVQWTWPALSDEQKGWTLKGELVTTQKVPRTNPQDGNSPIDYRKALHIGTLNQASNQLAVVPVGDVNAPTGASVGQVPVGQEGTLRLVVPADAVEDRFQWSVRWSLVDAQGRVQGMPWLMQPKLARVVSPITLRLEKEIPNPWNWNKDESPNAISVVIEARQGITGTAQLIWQGLPSGISTDPTDIELTGGVQVVSLKLPDLSQQAAGAKVEGIKLVVQWKPKIEGYNAPFSSPPLTLPALNFP